MTSKKGENWDSKLATELSESNYGIICLTPQNVNAPWVHFEAGAIAKTYESRVSALMLNIKPSEIKGPLSRFQATKFEKIDFEKLIQSVNNSMEKPLDSELVKRSFEAIWPTIETEISNTIKKHSISNKTIKPENVTNENNAALEEMLQLLRRQSSILSNPKELLPAEYIEYIMERRNEIGASKTFTIFLSLIYNYINEITNISLETNKYTRIEPIVDEWNYRIKKATNFFLSYLLSEMDRPNISGEQKNMRMRFRRLQSIIEASQTNKELVIDNNEMNTLIESIKIKNNG